MMKSELKIAIAQPNNDAQALAHQGESYRLTGDCEAALSNFDEAIRLNPDYSWAIAHQGEMYYQLKRYEEALTDFSQAIALNSEYAWAIAHRGVTYRFMGEAYYPMALADLDRAIELNPDYFWAIAYRCRVHELRQCYKKALIDFDRAMSYDKTIFGKNWLIEKGLLFCYDGQYEQAIDYSQQRLQQAPDDITALYCIAISKARWQGLDKAKNEIKRSRSALHFQWATENRGDILYRLSGLAILENNCESAWQYLREAIPLNDEAIELVGHDPAWQDWRHHQKTKETIAS